MGENFGRALISWYNLNKRDLPWRDTRDPYKIWLSEVILQQTQVAQGLAYYNRFITLFPTVSDLAGAHEDTVLRAWQGLGYYSRARNLLFSARQVMDEFGGRFPGNYHDLLKLRGVGTYTAAAVASFAYGQAFAVVDGNVYRVLSRVFGIEEPIDSTSGKRIFSALAEELLDAKRPALYNQAIMEFGALHCRPVNPSCGPCILKDSCQAFSSGDVERLPVKSKKGKVRERHFNYLVIGDGKGKVLINKRKAGDIWQGLYEFPLIETAKSADADSLLSHPEIASRFGGEFELKHVSGPYVHVLSHQRLHSVFYVMEAKEKLKVANGSARISELQTYAFPRLITRFLEECDLEEIF
jgi:A/G-specific adenine glycosylase